LLVEKLFYRYQQTNTSTDDLFAKMVRERSKSELDSIFNNIQCLMTNNEKRMFKKSNLIGKQSFLIGFWEKHDTDPQTVINEYRIKIEQRINYTIDKYSTSMTKRSIYGSWQNSYQVRYTG